MLRLLTFIYSSIFSSVIGSQSSSPFGTMKQMFFMDNKIGTCPFIHLEGSIIMNYSKTVLTMTRDFDVAAEKVFDAWLNPEMMKKWFFTLEGTNKVAQNTPQ